MDQLLYKKNLTLDEDVRSQTLAKDAGRKFAESNINRTNISSTQPANLDTYLKVVIQTAFENSLIDEHCLNEWKKSLTVPGWIDKRAALWADGYNEVLKQKETRA